MVPKIIQKLTKPKNVENEKNGEQTKMENEQKWSLKKMVTEHIEE